MFVAAWEIVSGTVECVNVTWQPVPIIRDARAARCDLRGNVAPRWRTMHQNNRLSAYRPCPSVLNSRVLYRVNVSVSDAVWQPGNKTENVVQGITQRCHSGPLT